METLFTALMLVGTVATAASGAMTALRKNMDLVGVWVLGLITAVGGGILRDVIIGRTPPVAFVEPIWLLCATAVSLFFALPPVCKLLAKEMHIYNRVLFWMDTVGLGIFTVGGIRSAAAAGGDGGLTLLLFVGVVTGVGGGVMRDVLAGNTPYIFSKHIYALASLAGAAMYALVARFLPEPFPWILGGLTVVLIRVLAAYFRWNLPHYARYFAEPPEPPHRRFHRLWHWHHAGQRGEPPQEAAPQEAVSPEREEKTAPTEQTAPTAPSESELVK